MAGGINASQMDRKTAARLLPEQTTALLQELFAAKVGTRPGVNAQNILSVGAAVVNGDVLAIERIYSPATTFKTFEVDIINTDAGVNTANTAAGALAGTGTEALVTLGAAPATAISVGDVIRIENELLLVLRKNSTTQYVCARAYGGSAIASHLQNLDVFVSDSVPTNISVPLVTTLTAAAFAAAFVAVFNWTPPTGEDAPARTTPHVGTYTAVPSLGLGAGAEIVILADDAGADVTAVSEEFANSTDNVWAAATMFGGQAPGNLGAAASTRAPTATEELNGRMHFAFPFNPRTALVAVRVAATGVVKLFAGSFAIGYVESTDATMPANVVTVLNVGAASTAYAAPWATTDLVTVVAFE